MNRILLVSDSHGLKEELQIIRKRHTAAYYLHVGDSELETQSPYLTDYQSVLGNCDWAADFPMEKTISVGGLQVFVTHGHLHDVKGSLLKLQYAAAEEQAQIACFGHSHIPFCEKIDNCIFINPGSLRLPRNYPEPTYVIVEWEDQTEISIRFYNMDGKQLEDLSKTFSI